MGLFSQRVPSSPIPEAPEMPEQKWRSFVHTMWSWGIYFQTYLGSDRREPLTIEKNLTLKKYR